MTDPAEPASARLIFPETRHGLTVSEFRATIDSLNNAYEFLSIGILPGYEYYPLSDRIAPRIYSRLIDPDELRIGTLTYGSPLVVALQSYAPYVVPALASFFGGVGFKNVIKDGGDSVAALLHLRENARSKKAKFERDEAKSNAEKSEYELERLRNIKSIEALRNTGRDRSGSAKYIDSHSDGYTAYLPEEIRPPFELEPEYRQRELEIEHFRKASDLAAREAAKVVDVAGPPVVDG